MPQLEWLTADIWSHWDDKGRSEFMRNCEKLVSDKTCPVGLKSEGAEDEFGHAVYELIMSACRGDLDKEKVPVVIHDLITMSPTAANVVSDALSLLDQETSASSDESDIREVYCYIVRNCEGILGHVFQERLDVETLPEAAVVGNGKVYTTRFIRVKTKLYYKQQKFNLLREESEGYAKLISELSQSLNHCSPSSILKVIQCLIGRFNLDPNRVVDLVLEAYECQPDHNFFISLLRLLQPSSTTICELIGFKVTNSDEPEWTLFVIIASLLQHGIIMLEEIYPWLTPGDGGIQKDWERELKDAKEYARKSMIILVNKEKDAVEDVDSLAPAEDRHDENQKFMLCQALLAIGDWEHASIILQKFPEFALISKRALAVQLSNLLHYIMDPLYLLVYPPADPHTDPNNMLDPRNPLIPTQITNFEEFYGHISMFLAIGPYAHYDPVLLAKILRVMKSFLENVKEETELYFAFITVFEEVVLPALNFLDVNCCMSEEIWTAISYYPYHHRFRLYGAWKGEAVVLIHPSLLRRRVDTIQKIKHLMRRISKDNVKPMGRLLGKLAHSMPGVVFDYVLSQIQLFDNLITPVIDALKFLTNLSYDVLTFCLLEALSPSSNSNTNGLSVMLMPNRPRTKHDGSTISPWLQSLSSFAGSICKKYTLDLVPLLQYVANQLKTRQSSDLLLLKEIVQKMAGIEAMEDITEEQLDAMAGGELLRAEAGSFGQIRTAKKSATRLREAASLNDLAVTLCILMAQQRNGIIYDEAQTLHTKLVGKLYDQCQDTLVQFGSFLASSCTLDDYAKKIPPLQNLVEDYHVSSDVAFFLWRPLFSNEINAKYDNLRRVEKNHKSMNLAQKRLKYAEAAGSVLDPISEMLRNHLSAKTWEDISPQFYVTFWSLTLSDLFVPTEAYAREINRVKQLSNSFSENKELASSKRKKEQERCAAIIEKLQDEERRQMEHVDRVKAKLSKEKDTWFASRSAKSAKNEAVTAFLQMCLFPRCIFTAPDALYCAHFVHTIHALSTPNFSTLICYDRIFCDIIYAVTSCTENEANRYGQFLNALLGTVMKWHSEKAVFNKECASFPGFVTKFRATTTGMAESNDHVDYENYRHVCHKWHYKITKCVIVCLESNDVTQIRNALIVLRRVLPHYPKVMNLASAVERWIERVRCDQKDKRQDLFALATSYIGQLKTRLPSLVPEEDFHQKNAPEKPNVDNKVTKPKNVPEKTTTDGKTSKPKSAPEKPATESKTKVVAISDTKIAKQAKPIETSKVVKSGEVKTTVRVVISGGKDEKPSTKVSNSGLKGKEDKTSPKEKKRPSKSGNNELGSSVTGSSTTGSGVIKHKNSVNGTLLKSELSNDDSAIMNGSISSSREHLPTTSVTTSGIVVNAVSSSSYEDEQRRDSRERSESRKKREKKKGERKRDREDAPTSSSKRRRAEDDRGSSSLKSRRMSTTSTANGDWIDRDRSSPKDKDRSPRDRSSVKHKGVPRNPY